MEKFKYKAISILRRSEKYVKTDMVYLVGGGFWLTIGQIVASGATFITSIAFANLLPPETYGIYKYLLSITSILTLTTLTGMDSSVMQAVARGYDGSLSLGVRAKIRWGILGTLASLLIALYYYTQGNSILALSFCIISIFTPFYEAFDMYNSFLFGKKLFNIQTKYSIIRKIITLVVIIGTLLITDNIYIIISVYFISLVLPASVYLNRTLHNYKQNNNVDLGSYSYGKHLSAINIIGLVVAELDKILIFHYIGPINLAIYTLAIAPTDQIKGLLKSVNSMASPKFAEQDMSLIKKAVWYKVKVLTMVTTTLVIGYIIAAPFFFKIFFPKYLASIIYSQLLAISLIVAIISAFLYTILEAKKARKQLYQFNLYSNIISIVVLFPLVYLFGILGAVISRIVNRIFSLILSIILFDNAK